MWNRELSETLGHFVLVRPLEESILKEVFNTWQLPLLEGKHNPNI